MAPEDAEIVVVGAGLLGLATARELATRGREVVVLEAETVGGERSGSKASARIFRLGYDDPLYVGMAKQALSLWRELEAECDEILLVETGQLTFGRPGDATALAGLRDALATGAAPFELLSPDEARRRWPQVTPHGDGVFEPLSGVLRADRCLAAIRSLIPGVVSERSPVRSLRDTGDVVEVVTDDTLWRAQVAVCCAGPGSRDLLGSAGIGLALTATLEQVAYFAAGSAGGDLPPVVIELGEPLFYGLPTPSTGLYKAARHHAGTIVDAASATFEPDEGRIRQVEADVARLLPGLRPVAVETERCLYDTTPDEDFVLDRVGRIVIGCGTSGHGYKFGPLLGRVIADLALAEEPEVPIARFSAARAGLRVGL
ncbi:MAG TPA: FAD-dependent oxidoreductase [Acidimicrobiales bacterium]|nr:FAD-dependent oxidoreductase [Acidimicrobiales bacterium]